MEKKIFPRIARLMQVQGALLVIVAAIHLLATRALRGFIESQLSESEFEVVWPPFALNHIVVGILLVPVGLSTFVLARGVAQAQRSAWLLATFNAVALLTLPVAMALLMGVRYFAAIPFLAAAILVTAVGLSMWVPLLIYRSDFH